MTYCVESRARKFFASLLAVVAAGSGACSMGARHSDRGAGLCDISYLREHGLDAVTVVAAHERSLGDSAATAAAGGDPVPAHCRISGTAQPSNDSLIQFELWAPPLAQWNGKLVVTGNGGYSPTLSYRDMAHALRQGYAVAGGDTGHQTESLDFVVGHPQRMLDWGTRSVHAVTVPAKSLLARLYGRRPARSYFFGCSTGGHQGIAEAERYPDDFDGIVAGAPGNNRVALNAEFLWRFLSNHRFGDNRQPILGPMESVLLHGAAVRACDRLDGTADGIIDDPRNCTREHLEPRDLQCGVASAGACLTAEQVQAAAAIYRGPHSPRTGERIYPGPQPGSELDWPAYWGNTEPARADFWRFWVFGDARWNWWHFDFDRHVDFAKSTIGAAIDHVSADLGAFSKRGGKLLLYHGWNDAVVSPLDTIAYYDRARARLGPQAGERTLQLFLVPGMGHCSGGSGATHFGNSGGSSPIVDAEHDVLTALDIWVESQQPPAKLIATRIASQGVAGNRTLCPYPQKAAAVDSDGDATFALNACR